MQPAFAGTYSFFPAPRNIAREFSGYDRIPFAHPTKNPPKENTGGHSMRRQSLDCGPAIQERTERMPKTKALRRNEITELPSGNVSLRSRNDRSQEALHLR